jgi:prephenate dehydrogenase
MDSTGVMFDKVAIFGPGLIGGSMGLALRERGLARAIVGIGRRQESLDKALAVGAIDTATLDPADGVRGADLVVLATPIRTFEAIMAATVGDLRPEALVTDVASTKARVVRIVSSALRRRPDISYIPTHPMAGGEKSGPEAASLGMFEGAVCIITPLPNTVPESKSAITRMWQAMGARVVSMTPQAHDRAVARVSHLPHLAAAALMAGLDPHEVALCGRGLLDTTRVASGNPDIWIDICRSNREEVREAVLHYIAVLQKMADNLDGHDYESLRELLADAKQRRDDLLDSRNAASRLNDP